VLKNCAALFFFISFICQCTNGQLAMPRHFAHYGVTNGLAAYNTSCVAQDENGFIWIGTINGLQRFDGSRFINFRHNPADNNSIPDNNVEQMLLDKFNNLWLVLNDGSVGIFDTRRFVFKKAKLKLSNENNLQLLRRLYEDSEGNMIFTFFNTEAITYNRNTNEFSAATNPFPLPLNWKPVWTIQDPVTKKYWIGTDSGMAVYNKQTHS
jgi:ligand-binding sensor domain-containing protein